MGNAVSGSRLKAAVLSAWIILALFTQAFCTPSYADDCETARPKVGESSSSNSATTPASRKSFYDSTSKLHWAFWYNGSAIEYASSDGSQSWVSQGTIAYNTANFSLISKIISGTTYIFLVSEANTYDVVLVRGSVNGDTITFDAAVTVYDGSSANDRYILPHVALDSNDRIWVAALKDLGEVGDRYHTHARRSSGSGAGVVAFESATPLGKPAVSVASLSMVPTSGDAMLLAVSGESSNNIIAYSYNGSAWNEVKTGGEITRVGFGVEGVSDLVSSVAVSGNNIYIGGVFTSIDGMPLNYIAKWNGTSWSALSGGMNNWVATLSIDPSGYLVAGGDFTTAGGVVVNRIAKWNGSSWSALGGGVDSIVYATGYDISGNLFAGGNFIIAGGVVANRIARWNGSSWSSLGGGFDGSVHAIQLDSSGNLYAGGWFSNADGIAVDNIAKWNGSSWIGLGDVDQVYINTIALAQNGDLYIGGLGGVSKRNGTSWDLLGVDLHSTNKIIVDDQNNLYGGGNRSSGPITIAKWTGTSWSALGSATDSDVDDIAIDSSGNIIAVGWFSKAGGITARGIAKWNGTSWTGDFTTQKGGFNSSLLSSLADGSGNIYVGGNFTTAGGSPVNFIAKWNGSSWSTLGDGLNERVAAIAMDPQGNIYAGGWFSTAGGIPANGVAKWNGTSWSALGDGLNSLVYTLATDNAGNLYAGGSFNSSGSTSVNYIAKWNGTSWSALGGGVNGFVSAMVVDGDGNLYAGGGFSSASGLTVNSIAKWNGTAWSALGGGVNDSVFALTLDNSGNLYAGGYLTSAGGVSVNRIAKWNGNSWSAMGGGFADSADVYDLRVLALTSDPAGNIYAGGTFTSASGTPVNYIAQWNGASWSAFGPGATGTVNSLSIYGSDIYAAGISGLAKLTTSVTGSLLANTSASLVAGESGASHLLYIDSNRDLISRTISGSPPNIGAATTVHSGYVSSVSAGLLPISDKLVSFFVESGQVKYSSAASPYTSWSSATTLSCSNTPKNISSHQVAGAEDQILGIWSATGGGLGTEVRSVLVDASGVVTPTIPPNDNTTPTPTPTPTSTSTPSDLPAPGEAPAIGVVLDSSGRALSGVIVYVLDVGLFVTNENGEFALPAISTGKQYTVYLKKQGYQFGASSITGGQFSSISASGLSQQNTPSQCERRQLRGKLLEVGQVANRIFKRARRDFNQVQELESSSAGVNHQAALAGINTEASAVEARLVQHLNRVLMANFAVPEVGLICPDPVRERLSCSRDGLRDLRVSMRKAVRALRMEALLANRRLYEREARSQKLANSVRASIKLLSNNAFRSLASLPLYNDRC